MNKDKQIEEMASAVRERTVACNKCEYYKEGSCLKPIDLGCDDNEDILNLCDAIYEIGYRKAYEVAREIFEEIEEGVKAAVSALQFENNPIHRKVKHEAYSSLMRFIKTVGEKYTEGGE